MWFSPVMKWQPVSGGSRSSDQACGSPNLTQDLIQLLHWTLNLWSEGIELSVINAEPCGSIQFGHRNHR